MANRAAITYFVGLVLVSAWSWLLYAGTKSNDLDLAAFVALLAITSYLLSRHKKASSRPLPLPITVASALLASLAIFSLWGSLTDKLFLPDFVSTTKNTRIAWFFASGPIISVITGLAVAYPLTTLFSRYWPVPAFLGALIAFFVQFPGWFSQSSSVVKAITVVGQLSFFVLTPLSILFLAWVCGWVANNSFKPTPLRGVGKAR
jgi:hypothetical protein